jgi:hypothetical protein
MSDVAIYSAAALVAARRAHLLGTRLTRLEHAIVEAMDKRDALKEDLESWMREVLRYARLRCAAGADLIAAIDDINGVHIERRRLAHGECDCSECYGWIGEVS